MLHIRATPIAAAAIVAAAVALVTVVVRRHGNEPRQPRGSRALLLHDGAVVDATFDAQLDGARHRMLLASGTAVEVVVSAVVSLRRVRLRPRSLLLADFSLGAPST